MSDDQTMVGLRAEIESLLADALTSEQRHADELERRDELHLAETARRDQAHIDETHRRDRLHVDELERRDDLHAHELEMVRTALESRDIIGQAKGVIMTTMGCSAEKAFDLLREQSMHQNRKLVEVAAEVASRASRSRSQPPPRSGG